MASELRFPIGLAPSWNADQLTAVLADPATRRLAPWIFHHSQRHACPLPANVRDRFRTAHLAALRQDLLQRQEILRILRQFSDAGIPTIPLKGPFLGERLYGQPGTRPSADIDVLVKPGDLDAAGTLLEQLGYTFWRRGHYDVIYMRPGSGDVPWMVELHHGLGYLARTAHGWRSNVWDRAGNTETDGVHHLQMERGDEIIYLCLNLIKHRFDSPALALDIHLVLQNWGEDIDWPTLIHRARKAGLDKYVAVACLHSAHCFGTMLPDVIASNLSNRMQRYFEDYEWTGRTRAFVDRLPLNKHLHLLLHLILLSRSFRDRWDHFALAARKLINRRASIL